MSDTARLLLGFFQAVALTVLAILCALVAGFLFAVVTSSAAWFLLQFGRAIGDAL